MKRKRSARCRLGWAWLRGAARSSAGDPRGDTGGHRPAEVGFTEDCGGEQRCVHRGAQSPCGGERAWLLSPRPPPPRFLWPRVGCASRCHPLTSGGLRLPNLVKRAISNTTAQGTQRGRGGLCGGWLGVPIPVPRAARSPACVTSPRGGSARGG